MPYFSGPLICLIWIHIGYTFQLQLFNLTSTSNTWSALINVYRLRNQIYLHFLTSCDTFQTSDHYWSKKTFVETKLPSWLVSSFVLAWLTGVMKCFKKHTHSTVLWAPLIKSARFLHTGNKNHYLGVMGWFLSYFEHSNQNSNFENIKQTIDPEVNAH